MPRRCRRESGGGPPAGGLRRLLRWGGVLPAALLVAAGVAIVAVGAVQGTLLPQFLHAAASGVRPEAPLDLFLTGLLILDPCPEATA